MLKVYYSTKIENVYWKIYTENISNSVFHFPDETTSQDLLMSLNQINLFEINKKKKINIINISEWKLSNKQTQSDIEELNKITEEVIFILEATSLKNKLFDKLDIKPIKVGNVTRKNKSQLVVYLLSKYGISLDFNTTEELLDLLPDNVQFITREIQKMSLTGKRTFNLNEIKAITFDTGETTIFKVIDAWLSNNQNETIHQLNNLFSSGFNILEVIPMFAYKLVQIKLFLQAKNARWSSETTTNKLGIPPWLQKNYANLKPYDQKLIKINDIISKLYNFDINIKKNNINKKDSFAVPYAQLIKILLE